MSKFRKYLGLLYVYSVIIGGIIFLFLWHTGRLSGFLKTRWNDKAAAPKIVWSADLLTPEEDPKKIFDRWEALSQENDYETIITETEGRRGTIARAYRTLAIFESGKHPHLLVEAMRNMNILMRPPTLKKLPARLAKRLLRGLGDPEAPGPTAKENLEAYREIINKLRIATEPRSLKKLQELEEMAAEEAAAKPQRQ